jgi:hypothetical protein
MQRARSDAGSYGLLVMCLAASGCGAPPENESDVATITSALTVGWTRKPGGANDIAIGGDGPIYSANQTAAWIIGANPYNGGYQVHRWDGVRWVGSNGGGDRIAVERSTALPWVVNRSNEIWHLVARDRAEGAATGTWWRYRGCATDIGAGFDENSVWFIGCEGGVYKVNPNPNLAPERTNDRAVAVKIAVDLYFPWIITASGTVYRRTDVYPWSGTWEQKSWSRRAFDIAPNYGAANSGVEAWIIDRQFKASGNGDVLYLPYGGAKNSWTRVPGGGTSIAVDGTWLGLTNGGENIYFGRID